MSMDNANSKNQAVISFGADHIVIERRYRAPGAVNDLLIAVWFLTGSIFSFTTP